MQRRTRLVDALFEDMFFFPLALARVLLNVAAHPGSPQAGSWHQQKASSCSDPANLAVKSLTGHSNVTDRRFVQPPSKVFLYRAFRNTSYELFAGWIRDIIPKDVGDGQSDVPVSRFLLPSTG